MANNLGFGCMRLPQADGHVDIELCRKMTDSFINAGFSYFDTALMYCNFESENAVRDMLVNRYPRESFELADKIHAEYVRSKEDPDDVFFEQLKKTGAGFFDYYLLHALNKEHKKIFDNFDCFNWLIEKKKLGLVKEIGFSFHDSPEFLDEVLTTHPEMDFVQLMINYMDWESDVQSRRLYEVARKHRKPIVVMEPLRGGRLANLPEAELKILKLFHSDWSPATWAIRFAASLPGVRVVLSGMNSESQMKDNIDCMKKFSPLTDYENETLIQIGEKLRDGGRWAIACTGCAYCVGKCPKKIPIPEYLRLYETMDKEAYIQLKCGISNESCIGCAECERMCPQKIPIRHELKAINSLF